MNLGISVDAKDAIEALGFIRGYYQQINHIQFYLEPNIDNYILRNVNSITQTFGTTFSYSFHSYEHINLCEPNTLIRKAWITTVKATIDLLENINGRFVNLHIGYFLSDSQNRYGLLNHVSDALEEICSYALNKNIDIHIENDFNYRGISRLGSSLEEIQFLLNLNKSNLKVCYDIGHANISFMSPYDYRKIINSIGSFHIHNNDGIIDMHLPIGAEGSIDLDIVYNELFNLEDIYFILENDITDYPLGLNYLLSRR